MLLIIVAAVAAAALGAGAVHYLTTKKARPTLPPEAPEEGGLPAVAVPKQISTQAREIIVEAKDEALKIRSDAEEEARRVRGEVTELEKKLEKRKGALESKEEDVARRERDLTAQQRGVSKKLEDLEKLRQEELEKLQKIAAMTKEEARQLVLERVDKELQSEVARRIKEAEEEAQRTADIRARDIVVSAIQRSGTDYVAEHTTSVVKLPDEEMKGRIIGREGRNIRALEQATGVDFDLDETPKEVRLSCFDPVKREVARIALERLVADGRIQPARIEEYVAKAQKDLEVLTRKAGEQLAYDVGVSGLPAEIIELLGRFKFRTSYGQNLVTHTLEVTRLAALMAGELGADVEMTKRAALLHDIGKVQTAEFEGPHARLTRRILEKHRFDEKLINAAAAHHEEEEFQSVEAVLIHIADALSGSRPGARFEDYERFIKRMRALEDAAYSFEGVDKAYAIAAGREVRVIVKPAEVDDATAVKLSRDVAKKIEAEQTYPGTVKVVVIRELRATKTAK